MTAVVTGYYEEVKVQLLETPKGLRPGRVRVILTDEDEPKPKPRYLEYGKYKGVIDPTVEDFKDAENCSVAVEMPAPARLSPVHA